MCWMAFSCPSFSFHCPVSSLFLSMSFICFCYVYHFVSLWFGASFFVLFLCLTQCLVLSMCLPRLAKNVSVLVLSSKYLFVSVSLCGLFVSSLQFHRLLPASVAIVTVVMIYVCNVFLPVIISMCVGSPFWSMKNLCLWYVILGPLSWCLLSFYCVITKEIFLYISPT